MVSASPKAAALYNAHNLVYQNTNARLSFAGLLRCFKASHPTKKPVRYFLDAAGIRAAFRYSSYHV